MLLGDHGYSDVDCALKDSQEENCNKELVTSDGSFRAVGPARILHSSLLTPIHMFRKGQIEGIAKGNVIAQNRFINRLFGVVA